MAGLLFLAFMVALIWAEVAVFAVVGSGIGTLATIIGVFVTAAIGLRLFRKVGTATMRRLQKAAASGRPPVLELADGGAITIAAGLLLLPGFITDAVGFVLFVPGLRTVLALFFMRFLFSLMPRGRIFSGGSFAGRTGTPEAAPGGPKHVPDPETPSSAIIDGEFKRKD